MRVLRANKNSVASREACVRKRNGAEGRCEFRFAKLGGKAKTCDACLFPRCVSALSIEKNNYSLHFYCIAFQNLAVWNFFQAFANDFLCSFDVAVVVQCRRAVVKFNRVILLVGVYHLF